MRAAELVAGQFALSSHYIQVFQMLMAPVWAPTHSLQYHNWHQLQVKQMRGHSMIVDTAVT